MHRRMLERAVNIGLVLAAVLVVFLAYRNFVKPRYSRRAISVNNQADPKVGDYVSSASRPRWPEGGLGFCNTARLHLLQRKHAVLP
jgi:hypothetical protein